MIDHSSPRTIRRACSPNSTPARFQNIPAALTPLIGREQQVQEVSTLLQHPEVRLLTITGPGGIGKTRLAQHVGIRLQDTFAHGVCFMSLASIKDLDLFLSTIVHTLEQGQVADLSSYQDLSTFLHDKQVLLLLDSFEHLLSAAPVLTTLLSDCPQVKILVTSRALLHVRGEHEFPVPCLALPDLHHLPASKDLSQVAAIALFVQRAQALRPGFQLSESNAHAIATICVRLDGLPLAIELAAARIKLLLPQMLLARLKQRLPILTTGLKDAPLRHQTLRNTIKWSVDLLTLEELCVFRRLAAFTDSWTLDAAEVVCADFADLTTPVMDLVASLMDKSLVYQRQIDGDEPRFSMLETLREYAFEMVIQAEEREHLQQVHAAYYLATARKAEPELYHGQQKAWLDRLDEDMGNLQTGLAWFQAHHQVESLMHLTSALSWFWFLRGHLHEGYRWAEHIIHLYGQEISSEARGKILAATGVFAGFLGQRELALARCQEAFTAGLEDGNLRAYMPASWITVHLLLTDDRVPAAHAQAERAFALAQASSDRWVRANALSQMGSLALHLGNQTGAQMLLEQSILLYEEEGDLLMRKWPLVRLAEVALARCDKEKAHQLLSDALMAFHDARDTFPQGLYLFGHLALRRGDISCARFLIEEAVKISQRIGDQHGIVQYALLSTQITALGQNDSGTHSTQTPPLDHSVDPPVAQPTHTPLSEREQDVLGLLARGASNAQIAHELVITIDTVKRHVSNILMKLGASNRTHATVLARELGLLSGHGKSDPPDQGHYGRLPHSVYSVVASSSRRTPTTL